MQYCKGAIPFEFNLSFSQQISPEENKAYFPSFKIFSLLYIDQHYFEVAIVGSNIKEEDIPLIPPAVSEVVNSVQNGKTRRGGTLVITTNEADTREIQYNRVVYIFTNHLPVMKTKIEDFFKQYQLRVKVRDSEYFINDWNERKPDIFICHDSRDKEEVADPLYIELRKRNIKVWYDKTALTIGDSLSEKIEEGIRNCRYGVIILSKNLLSNDRWAKNELQSFRTKQVIENKKVILPVWHQITENDIKKVSYWLVDKLAGNTNDLSALSEQIKKFIDQ